MSAPRTVIRGESPPVAVTCSVDWLGFTYFPPDDRWRTDLRAQLAEHFGVTGWERKAGWQGYESSARADGVVIAWGGEAQRGSVHVEVPGGVCGGCDSWPQFVVWLRGVGAKLTRVDLAADDHFGEAISVDWAVAQFRAGGFAASGRPPMARFIDDLGSAKGRTLYVGSREAGKLARIYEKGRQLGDRISRWCRFEIEWRAKDRVLSLDMLLRPSAYIAGSYPCASLFSAICESVRTAKARAVISYGQVIAAARNQAGRAINAILQVTGGDIGKVVSLLRRGGLPSRLCPREMATLTNWSS